MRLRQFGATIVSGNASRSSGPKFQASRFFTHVLCFFNKKLFQEVLKHTKKQRFASFLKLFRTSENHSFGLRRIAPKMHKFRVVLFVVRPQRNSKFDRFGGHILYLSFIWLAVRKENRISKKSEKSTSCGAFQSARKLRFELLQKHQQNYMICTQNAY